MSRRKPTPIQIWREHYAITSTVIKQMKQAIRNDEHWGQFKVPKTQRLLSIAKKGATQAMEVRGEYQLATAQQWQADSEARMKRRAEDPGTIGAKHNQTVSA